LDFSTFRGTQAVRSGPKVSSALSRLCLLIFAYLYIPSLQIFFSFLQSSPRSQQVLVPTLKSQVRSILLGQALGDLRDFTALLFVPVEVFLDVSLKVFDLFLRL
jgi:hypothetical protein